MKICLVTDAWLPQVNGVVRTLQTVAGELMGLGHAVHLVTPNLFATVPCPTYPQIRLSLNLNRVKNLIDSYRPEAIHIATEGPLGWAARNYCVRKKIPFTTSFHTRFPEYVKARFWLPLSIGYAILRWFHSHSQAVLVPPSIKTELEQKGFDRLIAWSRGVDAELFRPEAGINLNFAHPIYLYVGRVAVEKNLEAFLNLRLDGTKLVVGDGPQLADLKEKYPDVKFVGEKRGVELAGYYAASDCFVFPSKTDTFGLVILEALASGIPVAAYPVPGPREILQQTEAGALNDDLYAAIQSALRVPKAKCRTGALQFTWSECARRFLNALAPINAN